MATITGTIGNDILDGTAAPDVIFTNGGADVITAGAGDDVIVLDNSDGSIVDGGDGLDVLFVMGTSTALAGLSGIEEIELDMGARLNLTGSQFMNGLSQTVALEGAGTLTVDMDAPGRFISRLIDYRSAGVQIIVNGSTGSDIIKLGRGRNMVDAGDGIDSIKGFDHLDTINGGAGNDKINGGAGGDILTGGAGADTFKYARIVDSPMGSGPTGANRDSITDFAIGEDKLNFSKIDTDAGLPGDQGFIFIGNTEFANSGIAQIRYLTEDSDLVVQADVNGDGIPDMAIVLMGLAGQVMTAGDFVL